MLFHNIFHFALWASIIEFIGALVIVYYVFLTIKLLLRTRDIMQARLLLADGIIYALSFKVAGTLLKTIELQTWQQILMFSAILTIRTILKSLFVWERKEIQKRLLVH